MLITFLSKVIFELLHPYFSLPIHELSFFKNLVHAILIPFDHRHFFYNKLHFLHCKFGKKPHPIDYRLLYLWNKRLFINLFYMFCKLTSTILMQAHPLLDLNLKRRKRRTGSRFFPLKWVLCGTEVSCMFLPLVHGIFKQPHIARECVNL